MLRLLLPLSGGNGLKPDSRDFLLAAMGRTVTAPERIRGLSPARGPVARKSRAAGGIANDVGFVTLPVGRRFALAIFTSGSTSPPADRAVAETARAFCGFFALR